MIKIDKIKIDKNSRLLVKTATIPFSGKFASAVGRPSALFLQQLNYRMTTEEEYIGKVIDGRRWIYNTYDDWCKELKHYCSRTIRSSIRNLENLGIIDSKKFNAFKGDQTKWYTINYDVLQELFPWIFDEEKSSGCTVECIKNTRKISENQDSCSDGSYFHFFIKKQKDTNIISITSNKFLSKKLKGKLKIKNRKDNQLKKIDIKSKTQTSQIELFKLTDINKLNISMKQIWERVIEGNNNSIFLTKKLCRFFIAAFQKKFNNSLEQWEAFCRKITTSAFLMGRSSSSFKASLEWVLRFDVIDKIIKGYYGVKELKQAPPTETHERFQALKQQINTASESDKIISFRQSVLQAVGVNTYSSWFKETTICEQNGTFTVTADSNFKTDYIHTHFGEVLKQIIEKTSSPVFQMFKAA